MARRGKKKGKKAAAAPAGSATQTRRSAGAKPPQSPSPAAAVLDASAGLRVLALDDGLLWRVAKVALVLLAVWATRELWVTFLFSGVLVFFGAPLVAALGRRGIQRGAGAAIVLFGLGAVLLLLSLMVVPQLVRDIVDLVAKVPAAVRSIERFFAEELGFEFSAGLTSLLDGLSADLLAKIGGAAKAGGAVVGKGAVSLVGWLGAAAGKASLLLLVPVLAYFMLTELPGIARLFSALAPDVARRYVDAHGPEVNRSLQRLLRGQLMVAGLMSGIYAVGLLISGVPLALGISVLSGIAYLIPFASATTCIGLSAAFATLELGGDAGIPIVGAVITAVIAQLLEGWVLTPRVVGDSAGLSPLAVILAVLVFGTWFGFLGVLFALPIATSAAVILRARLSLVSVNLETGAAS